MVSIPPGNAIGSRGFLLSLETIMFMEERRSCFTHKLLGCGVDHSSHLLQYKNKRIHQTTRTVPSTTSPTIVATNNPSRSEMIFLCKLLLAMGFSAVSAMPKAAETTRSNDRELQGSIALNGGRLRQSSINSTKIGDNQRTTTSAIPDNSLLKGNAQVTKLPSQSPIDIITGKAIDADYASFHFGNYEKIFPESLKNNGETVKLKIETDDLDEHNLPFISGGGLFGRYRFEQLHFHWGEGSRGSEHRIDGKQYAAELHIVHYNAKYENIMKASGEKDGVAALAILIELQARDNKVFRHLQQFEAIIDPTENDSDKLDVPFPLDDLLPDSTESFFRYNGSLTTPVFTEGVIWTVFDTPIAISKGQLAKFRLLLDKQGNRIRENVREIQELNDREIFYRAEQDAEDNDLPDDDERFSRDS